MPRLIKVESPRHTEAFERYYAMGRDRSYARLAAELRVDEDSVKLWGRSCGWRERLDARDQEISREVRQQSTKSAVIDRTKRRKAAEMGFVQWVNDLKAGKLKPKFSDFKDLFLMMEAEDRDSGAGGLSNKSTPQQIVAFLESLSADQLTEVIQLMTLKRQIPGPVLILPDNGSNGTAYQNYSEDERSPE